MRRILLICIALSCLFSSPLLAAHSDPPDRDKFEAAIKECEATVKKDSDGRPDRQAMEKCMSAKGFTRPEGGPGDGNPPPQR